MFTKNKVTESMIEAVKQVTKLDEASPIKEPTSTGMKVYGRSYGNSAKAKQDQTKHELDKVKGPKDKEMKEELKGNQHKIDVNHNDKIDGQDFAILRGKKKVKESFNTRLAEKWKTMKEKKDMVMPEEVRKSDVPAYLRKAKGDTPLTVADVKGPKKDSISAPENLAKNRNEWKEDVDYTEEQLDEMLNEVLGKDATAGDWIHDFVHSDNPKFAGKSKAERKKMALGAYYGKQNEATIAGVSGWKKSPGKDGVVTDKSGAKHTPMSRAKDLARAAFKKVQDRTKLDK